MPIGGSPTFGLITYAAIKVLGYSLFGGRLHRWYKTIKPPAFVFGVARTVLGFFAGVITLFVLGLFKIDFGIPFLLVLVPVRYVEWFLMLYFFYEKDELSLSRISGYAVAGIVWSFILDIPVIVTLLLLPGGVWVC